MLLIEIILFTFSLWLGAYLWQRRPAHPTLYWTGAGLAAYAFALGLDMLLQRLPTAPSPLYNWQMTLFFLPMLFWIGAGLPFLSHLEEAENALVDRAELILLAETILFLLLGGGTNLLFNQQTNQIQPFGYLVAALIIIIFTLMTLRIVGKNWQEEDAQKRPFAYILTAVIFFGLGIGLILFPQPWLPRSWAILAIGADLLLLGYAIGGLDALAQGERFLLDFSRSLLAALAAALLLGGQVGWLILASGDLSWQMLLLLLTIIGTAVLGTTFANRWQRLLDKLLFANHPDLLAERGRLRDTTDTLPRATSSHSVQWDEETLSRLTRRALTNMDDLPKLTASPLLQLPLLKSYLQNPELANNSLARAAALKRLLLEAIERLKPPDGTPFSAADEWRHYNALFYPYARSLKAYSRRANHIDLTTDEQEALQWLRAEVPQRTLYNWQKAAAQLIARDLQEQLQKEV